MKPLLKVSFQYIFPKPNWSAIPLPLYIMKMCFVSLKLYLPLLQFTYKVDPKMPSPKQITKKMQHFTQALIAMLVKFKMCVLLLYIFSCFPSLWLFSVPLLLLSFLAKNYFSNRFEQTLSPAASKRELICHPNTDLLL